MIKLTAISFRKKSDHAFCTACGCLGDRFFPMYVTTRKLVLEGRAKTFLPCKRITSKSRHAHLQKPAYKLHFCMILRNFKPLKTTCQAMWTSCLGHLLRCASKLYYGCRTVIAHSVGLTMTLSLPATLSAQHVLLIYRFPLATPRRECLKIFYRILTVSRTLVTSPLSQKKERATRWTTPKIF